MKQESSKHQAVAAELAWTTFRKLRRREMRREMFSGRRMLKGAGLMSIWGLIQAALVYGLDRSPFAAIAWALLIALIGGCLFGPLGTALIWFNARLAAFSRLQRVRHLTFMACFFAFFGGPLLGPLLGLASVQLNLVHTSAVRAAAAGLVAGVPMMFVVSLVIGICFFAKPIR